MYGGSVHTRNVELEEQAEASRQQSLLSRRSAESSLPVRTMQVHVEMHTTLAKAKANPTSGASWSFVPKSKAINALAGKTPSGTFENDPRTMLVHSVELHNAGSNFPHGEIAFDIPLFPEKVVITDVGTQTGSIHPHMTNPSTVIVEKNQESMDTVRLQLLKLTEQEVRDCFFEAKMPNNETFQAVHKGTVAARAVILAENQASMLNLMKQRHVESGGTLATFREPLLLRDHGPTSPLIYLSKHYYDYALQSALNFAQKQQDLSDKTFTNLTDLTVQFKPSGRSWAVLADALTANQTEEYKHLVLNTEFYASFDLSITCTNCDGLVGPTASS